MFKIFNLVKQIDPDLIHSWLYGSDLIASILAIFQNRKNILEIRSTNTMKHLDVYSKIVVKLLSFFSGTIPKKIIANSYSGKIDHVNLGYANEKIELFIMDTI